MKIKADLLQVTALVAHARGYAFDEMLDREISLTRVLERKVRRAAKTGSPSIPVPDLFPQ